MEKRKGLLPKVGTKVSIEWTEAGVVFGVTGTGRDVLVSFVALAGDIAERTGIPIKHLANVAGDCGKEAYEELVRNGVTVDLIEMKRQAARMKEDGKRGSENGET